MPGGYIGGWYGDTGLDIAGNHLPVYAVAAGILEYSERGHTLWMTPPDTPFSVRIALDEPVPWKGTHRVTHVYYTHMSRLEFEQAEGAPVRRHVEAGELLGVSGIGNHVAHLHLGVLLDGVVEQDTWDGILREGDIRALFGGYKNGELLPAFGQPAPPRAASGQGRAPSS
jgi:murein DD-endopeptidase MepM/ murein hydrolase activator NlpD